MSTVAMAEKSASFQYGFLLSRTSRLLAKIERREDASWIQEDAVDRKTIGDAIGFIDKALKGQQLLAGERRAGFSPTREDLEAFGYAISTIELLQGFVKSDLSTTEQAKEVFKLIRDVLEDISNGKPVGKDNLKLVHGFFSFIADRLLSDARELARPKSTLTSYQG